MPLRVVKDAEDNSIPARELRDKQLAQTTRWSCEACIGELVVRCGNELVSLSGGSWDIGALSDDCRVRVIPNGIIKLEVFDNEWVIRPG